jgi:hypothetical protein
MRCKFIRNVATKGAGVYYSASQNSNPLFGDCEFRENEAGVGGAVSVDSAAQLCHATFVNCLFAANIAQAGGAIAVHQYSGITLRNCTLADNEGTGTGGAAAIVHGHVPSNCPATRPTTQGWVDMFNTIVYGSDTPQMIGAIDADHCWVKETDEICNDTDGNLEGDPEFIGESPPNYRLQATSDCIDSGDNALAYASDPGDIDQDDDTSDPMPDLAGLSRISSPQGCVVDRGAYEYQATLVCSGDIDGN